MRRLAVRPSHRNRGIAHQLIDTRLQRARELGARAVGLHTSVAVAQAIYRKLGWQRVAAHDFTLATGIEVEAYVWSL
jgi:predicted N-acetyltransferase YhbS